MHRLRVGAHKLRVGYLIFENFENKYVNFALPGPPKVTWPIAFWSQCQGPWIYTYMTYWWTGPLNLEGIVETAFTTQFSARQLGLLVRRIVQRISWLCTVGFPNFKLKFLMIYTTCKLAAPETAWNPRIWHEIPGNSTAFNRKRKCSQHFHVELPCLYFMYILIYLFLARLSLCKKINNKKVPILQCF